MRNKNILLVDDENIILDSLAKDLHYEGYAVQVASSGEEAISKLKNDELYYDLVISDLVMGGIGGIEVLQQAKVIYTDICVIILTGYGDMTSAIEALRLGADDYLLKPCDTDELLLRMHRLFEKQEAMQKVKIYENILPMCMYCKSVRDDSRSKEGKEVWIPVDSYLYQKSKLDISHGCCPACYKKFNASL